MSTAPSNTENGESQNRWQWPVFLTSSVIFFLAITVWNTTRSPISNTLDSPPAHWNIDGVFYDNIAMNLVNGKGFVVDFHSQAWREQYRKINSESDQQHYRWVLQFEGSGPTALRPPAYPFALSLVYRVFGWKFDVARYFGMSLAAVGLAALVAWCYRRWGLVAAGISILTIVIDYSVMQASSLIASEPLGIFAFSMTFLTFARLIEKPGMIRALFCGLAFATLFLTRGNWNLGLILAVGFAAFLFGTGIRERFKPVSTRHIVVALGIAVCIGMPWWIRNCMVTKQFQPFGTAGPCGLIGAYCDEALTAYGNWQPEVFRENQRSVHRELDLKTVPLAEQEFLVGKRSTSRAMNWAKENWQKLPQLAAGRYLCHWGLFNESVPNWLQWINAAWLLMGLAGSLLLSGKFRSAFACLLLLDALIVMASWPHLGRYGIPVRPLLHIGVAIACVRIWRSFQKGRGGDKIPPSE